MILICIYVFKILNVTPCQKISLFIYILSHFSFLSTTPTFHSLSSKNLELTFQASFESKCRKKTLVNILRNRSLYQERTREIKRTIGCTFFVYFSFISRFYRRWDAQTCRILIKFWAKGKARRYPFSSLNLRLLKVALQRNEIPTDSRG